MAEQNGFFSLLLPPTLLPPSWLASPLALNYVAEKTREQVEDKKNQRKRDQQVKQCNVWEEKKVGQDERKRKE